MRVRGLKPRLIILNLTLLRVAPHAGAWIETYIVVLIQSYFMSVAPHAGAWIETCYFAQPSETTKESHPMRVRGLKLTETAELVVQSPLHPMQVRGLKLQSILCGRIQSVLLSCSYDLVIRWSMQRSNYANTWYIVCFHSIAYSSFSVVNITKTIKTGAILSKIYS